VFFVDGSLDLPVSPPTQSQPPLAIGLQSIAAFYDAIPNSVSKLKGTLIGPTHNDIIGQPAVTPQPHSRASMACMDTSDTRQPG
jgi:hypothetical protein